jgi:predicted MFS family arabinose efflux permease
VIPARGLGSGLVLAGVALIATCYGLARFAYGLFAPQLVEEFSLSSGVAGLIGGGSYVGYCVAIGLSTALTMRWGPRPVAVLAGTVATLGIAVVALAQAPAALAVGVLVAGCSTGIASPPLAAAVARWVRESVRDTAQTVVNAGTGVGVLISGPVALLLLDQWRVAWGLFALLAAAVTVWVAVVVPSTALGTDPRGEDHPPEVGSPGVAGLVLAGFAMGLSSIAVWTFGQELVGARTRAVWVAPVVWMVIGAAGVGGAFAGPIIGRFGLRVSWAGLMVLMAGGTAGLAAGAGLPAAAMAAGAVFGAAYIALTGVLLVWATRTYGTRPTLGVGLVFFMIAAGQAVGAPLAGVGADQLSLPTVFVASAVVALAAALLLGPTSNPRVRSRRRQHSPR